MKRSVAFVVLSGMALAGLGWTIQHPDLSQAAELDGFAIHTQDKSVTVTLFTDQRIPYATEHQGKQFTITLPATQLSKQQLDNGLPVVIDNKNRFIGRAVPTEDGKIKIILPNLPANDYAVSIQQKRPGQSAMTPAAIPPAADLKPRPAVAASSNAAADKHFEQAIAGFPKPLPKREALASDGNNESAASGSLRLSPTPKKALWNRVSNSHAIWNPYVVGPAAPVKVVAKPAPKAKIAASEPEAVTTLAVPDSLNSTPAPPPSAASDPLWYLHSLPTPAPNVLPGNGVSDPAALEAFPPAVQPAPKVATPVAAEPAKSSFKGFGRELREAFGGIPRWLLWTLALFLGGIGIFTLIGGLVLLKILFTQARQHLSVSPSLQRPVSEPLASAAPPPVASPESYYALAAKSPFTSRPLARHAVHFHDTASVRAIDYLKETPASVAQAVQNSTLVKFPHHRKQRLQGVAKAGARAPR